MLEVDTNSNCPIETSSIVLDRTINPERLTCNLQVVIEHWMETAYWIYIFKYHFSQ